MKLFLLGLLISNTAFSWTLNNNFGASFKDHKVKVYIDENTTCNNNSLTADQLNSLIGPAVDRFWNMVPTSKLKLIASGFSPATPNINNGTLCSPTDDDCISGATNLIPAVTNIIIACNDLADNFGAENVLAITIPTKFSGKKILGAVILINDAWNNGKFGQLSRSDQIAVIAHEIGHALGLGHSKESSALMYYRTVNLRRSLGQDDIDGISYLYPIQGDLYGLSEDGIVTCGTIGNDSDNSSGNPPLLQMGVSFGIFILLIELYKLLNRSKRSSST